MVGKISAEKVVRKRIFHRRAYVLWLLFLLFSDIFFVAVPWTQWGLLLGGWVGRQDRRGEMDPGPLKPDGRADGQRHENFFLPRSVWRSQESLLNAAAADEEKLSRMFRPQSGGKAPQFMAPSLHERPPPSWCKKKSDIRMLCFGVLCAWKKRSQIDFFLSFDLFPLLLF